MRNYLRPIAQIFSKYYLPIIFIGIIILVLLRIIQTTLAPNLLVNSNFEGDEVTEWRTLGAGSSQSTSKLSTNDIGNTVMQLNIPDTLEGSWVGVGQRVLAEPNQDYAVSLNYQLTSGDQSLSKVILRVSQFNQAGELIGTEDISDPNSLVANTSLQDWSTLAHKFVANEETVAIELGAGIVGQQATTVEVDDISLRANQAWVQVIKQDPAIILLSILLVIGFTYKLLRLFLSRQSVSETKIKLNPRLIAIIAVNIIIFFIFAEIVAVGIYFVRDGELFYTYNKTYELIEEEDETGEITTRRIHPYFGYIGKPGSQYQSNSPLWQPVPPHLKMINNHGLNSDHDYPFFKSNDDQFIIGVFGGSVAQFFTLTAQNELIENLKKDEFFTDKEIIVLNFTKGGYKQPQQLLILAYFLSINQKFDLVINIDGFNEVAFGARYNQDNLDTSMPHGGIIKGLAQLTDQNTLTPNKLESLSQINTYKSTLNTLAKRINSSQFASVNFILEQYYTSVLNKYQAELNRFEELDADETGTSLLFLKLNDAPLEDSALLEQVTETWVTSSIMMNQVLTAQGIPYFHFLQPNQYFSDKNFSDEEIKTALDDTYWEKSAVEKGYPALIEKIDSLEENNISFYNGIPIFDQEPKTVYIDSCCHYNQLGNQILAEFIAGSILESKHFSIP